MNLACKVTSIGISKRMQFDFTGPLPKNQCFVASGFNLEYYGFRIGLRSIVAINDSVFSLNPSLLSSLFKLKAEILVVVS
jgi:hypothetical protein